MHNDLLLLKQAILNTLVFLHKRVTSLTNKLKLEWIRRWKHRRGQMKKNNIIRECENIQWYCQQGIFVHIDQNTKGKGVEEDSYQHGSKDKAEKAVNVIELWSSNRI